MFNVETTITQAIENLRTKTATRENSVAITHLETALLWLRHGSNVTTTNTTTTGDADTKRAG